MRAAQQIQAVAIAGGAVVAWAAAFMTALYFTGRIERHRLRVVARSAAWAAFLSPGIAVLGHGVLPAPPVVVMFLPGHLLFGLMQMAVYTVIYALIGLSASALRGRG